MSGLPTIGGPSEEKKEGKENAKRKATPFFSFLPEKGEEGGSSRSTLKKGKTGEGKPRLFPLAAREGARGEEGKEGDLRVALAKKKGGRGENLYLLHDMMREFSKGRGRVEVFLQKTEE